MVEMILSAVQWAYIAFAVAVGLAGVIRALL